MKINKTMCNMKCVPAMLTDIYHPTQQVRLAIQNI